MAGLLAVACSTGDGLEDKLVVRDSASVQIVEISGASRAGELEAWRLSPEPVLRIGSVGGPRGQQLVTVEDAERLSDGRIVVADRGTSELRFFDPAGHFISAAGGPGEGPGEFSGGFGPASLQRVSGDTLLAYDVRDRRVSVFDPYGRFIGSRRITTPDGRAFLVAPVGFLDDRSFIAYETNSSRRSLESSNSQFERSEVMLLFFNPTGVLAATAGPFLGMERLSSELSGPSNDGFRVSVGPLRPFGKSFQHAADDGFVAVGSTDSYEIQIYGNGGSLERIIRRSRPPPPVTGDLIDAWIEARLATAEDAAERRERRDRYASMSFPDRLPAFASLQVDAGGRVWVRQNVPPIGGSEEPALWTVYGRAGRPLARVRMSASFPGFRPMDIGSDYLLGAWSDELDVEYVLMFALDR